MKLFLHWLRWDLLRFRWMLGIWVLLMLGYGVLIAWHGPEDKPWDPALVAGVWMVMLSFEVLAMLHLLTADPAVGVDLFWKTRPPRGIYTGGAKLLIILTAFVLLPTGVHDLLLTAGSLSPEGEKPMKWHEVLEGFQWWLMGLLALGAAAARTPGGAMVRIVIGMTLAIGVSVFCSSYLKLGNVGSGWGWSSYTCTFMSGLWLVVGTGLFVLARLSLRCAAWIGGLVWVAPALLLLLGMLLGPRVQRYQQARAAERFGKGPASLLIPCLTPRISPDPPGPSFPLPAL